MGKYCGYSILPSHVSSSNLVLIHFHSDGAVTEAGFKMEFIPLGKAHQFKTTLNIKDYYRELLEFYSPGPIVALNIHASITFFDVYIRVFQNSVVNVQTGKLMLATSFSG